MFFAHRWIGLRRHRGRLDDRSTRGAPVIGQGHAARGCARQSGAPGCAWYRQCTRRCEVYGARGAHGRVAVAAVAGAPPPTESAPRPPPAAAVARYCWSAGGEAPAASHTRRDTVRSGGYQRRSLAPRAADGAARATSGSSGPAPSSAASRAHSRQRQQTSMRGSQARWHKPCSNFLRSATAHTHPVALKDCVPCHLGLASTATTKTRRGRCRNAH